MRHIIKNLDSYPSIFIFLSCLIIKKILILIPTVTFVMVFQIILRKKLYGTVQ